MKTEIQRDTSLKVSYVNDKRLPCVIPKVGDVFRIAGEVECPVFDVTQLTYLTYLCMNINNETLKSF